MPGAVVQKSYTFDALPFRACSKLSALATFTEGNFRSRLQVICSYFYLSFFRCPRLFQLRRPESMETLILLD